MPIGGSRKGRRVYNAFDPQAYPTWNLLDDVMLDAELAKAFLDDEVEDVTGDSVGGIVGYGEVDSDVDALACKREGRPPRVHREPCLPARR